MDELVQKLIDRGILKTSNIIEAFRNTDRINFVRGQDKKHAYSNHPLGIGEGQTISQPLTVAFMLEKLQPEKGDRVLDVGSGSGWTTALLANIVGDEGEVIGLEIKPELVEFGRNNVQEFGVENTEIRKAEENILGIPGEEFDKILVSAAAKSEPQELLNQLKPKGNLVIPIRRSVFKISKNENGNINRQEFPGFAFVPLIH